MVSALSFLNMHPNVTHFTFYSILNWGLMSMKSNVMIVVDLCLYTALFMFSVVRWELRHCHGGCSKVCQRAEGGTALCRDSARLHSQLHVREIREMLKNGLQA